MDYVDDSMNYKDNGRSANRNRAMGMVDPELAQMVKSGNYKLAPSSASAPDKTPMRLYKKGGSVKPACKAKGGAVEIDVISVRPRGKMERMEAAADRRGHDERYDEKIIRESRGASKGPSPEHDARMRRLEAAKRANQMGKVEDEREMRKGGKMKAGKRACYAIGGAAKVRKGMESPAGQIKKVVKVKKPSYM